MNQAGWRGTDMPLQLDHTIVPDYDKVKSAAFIARLFGLKYERSLRILRAGQGQRCTDAGPRWLGPTLASTTMSSWPRTMSSTRSCNGSGTRGWSSGAGRGRGRTGEMNHLHQGAGFTSSARTGMCKRLLRTRMLQDDGVVMVHEGC